VRRVAVTVGAGEAEIARWRMLEICPDGLEERDLDGRLELAAYLGAAGEERVRQVFAHVTAADVAPGWEDAWRAFHRPVVAGGVWFGPPWEEPPSDVPAVVIDPGRAFGTGAHATTRLCVELLARVEPGSLLDVGCGSGVIAIAAARLGFGPVTAIDDDPVAVEVAAANASANAVRVDVRLADALVDLLPPAEVAVANVLLRPVEGILRRLDVRTVVTSGYPEGERPDHRGWTWLEGAAADGWAADLFERATGP
jgi:ribosomal protein L11 methyltransferase